MVEQDVLEAVRAGGLLAPGRPLVVMLSGGRDSTCLLDVALALRGAAELSALHVNYGLREQAGADERHCVALCTRLGVELEVVHAERSRPRRRRERAGVGSRAALPRGRAARRARAAR